MGGPAVTAHPDQRPYPAHHDGRLRVVVETSDPALLVADFRFLVDAGFEVACCEGPGTDPARCPILRGEGCDLVASADVVLHALDPGLGVAAAVESARPELPVVVERWRRRGGSGGCVPAGCVPLDMPSSPDRQLDVILGAARRRHGGAGAEGGLASYG